MSHTWSEISEDTFSRDVAHLQLSQSHHCYFPRFNVSCDCKKGTAWNSQYNTCGDVNECEDPSICSLGKTCVDVEGGYRCECPAGTVENRQTTKCEAAAGSGRRVPPSDSQGFLARPEYSDQSGTPDFGFGGNFGSSDESGFFGMFSDAVLSQVSWEAIILMALWGVFFRFVI